MSTRRLARIVGGLVAALVLLGCSENGKPGSITSDDGGAPASMELQRTAAAGRAIAFTGSRPVVVGDGGRAFVSPSVGPGI